MTYGDGVADIDIGALLAFHREEGCQATVTAVRPPGRFGRLDLEGKRARGFQEKPRGDGDWINGGFFVLSPSALDHIDSEATLWEKEPLQHLAATGQLAAFRHDGFWQPMDTLRDKNHLEQLWAGGNAPWKLWP
jgi:glucose-1-phosphate cytidylyltransferase